MYWWKILPLVGYVGSSKTRVVVAENDLERTIIQISELLLYHEFNQLIPTLHGKSPVFWIVTQRNSFQRKSFFTAHKYYVFPTKELLCSLLLVCKNWHDFLFQFQLFTKQHHLRRLFGDFFSQRWKHWQRFDLTNQLSKCLLRSIKKGSDGLVINSPITKFPCWWILSRMLPFQCF